MIDYASFYSAVQKTRLKQWLPTIHQRVNDVLANANHGDMPRWLETLAVLPKVNPSFVDLSASSVRVGTRNDCGDKERGELEHLLRVFHPWRKGPFEIFGTQLDTEWRSDLKWDRVKDAISPLAGRLVLDVGCGNGYHVWRMAGAGAELVMGIDPTLLYVMQFRAMAHYIQCPSVAVLPFGVEDLPDDMHVFDTVFSMGLLYHRRSPFDHLFQLRSCLRPGGELVLETLVVEGNEREVLVPEGRYAKMPNVWFIPSSAMLHVWLKKSGFENVRLVDVTKTTGNEQRVTDWMRFESLADYLDPHDQNRTCEGYPAPQRAVFIAQVPKK